MSDAFEQMQRRFVDRLGGRAPADLETGTMVVISSISFASEELRKISAIEHYEERLLCMLLFLENPSLRMVFVSSMPVEEPVVDYHLSFLRDPKSARSRLSMMSVNDPAPVALTEKLLRNPAAVAKLRSLVADRDDSFVLPFNVTHLERALCERIGVPLWGPPTELVALGSKSGSREVARRAGVPVLPGREDLFSLAEIESAIAELRTVTPGIRAAVIKLNNGFSGQGNALVDLDGAVSPLDRSSTTFIADDERWESFIPKIVAEGAIVEELLRNSHAYSPSVQLRIAPGGAFEVVSTHDQILGGPDDQVYLGCRFPARSEYRALIADHGRAIARVLAGEGVMGAFGVDFVVVPEGAGWTAYLTEINLRAGGTTHPFLTASRVTGGRYDEQTGELVVDGRPICYVASDNIKSPRYKGISPSRLIGALKKEGLSYKPSTQTGVTLHLLGALPRYGKVGIVCIAPDENVAAGLTSKFEGVLDRLAR